MSQCVMVCVTQEQASWVCQCEESLVSRLEQSFKQTLQQQVWLLGDANYMQITLSNYGVELPGAVGHLAG